MITPNIDQNTKTSKMKVLDEKIIEIETMNKWFGHFASYLTHSSSPAST